MQTIQQNIELFHLLFLRQLEGRLDKKLYSLKGGCNLRFYFKSIRYSEDIDFDVDIVSKSTLENKVSKILDSTDFKRILQSKEIAISQVNPSKQTQTTQRWKVLLNVPGANLSIPTKIEFSRRKMDEGVIYESVDKDVINQHKLYPILCNHYQVEAAFSQKIDALINRPETQARDIFDLKWLIDQGAQGKLYSGSKNDLQKAIANANSIDFSNFKGQVVAYLMQEYVSFYDVPEKWEEMRGQVIKSLERKEHEAN